MLMPMQPEAANLKAEEIINLCRRVYVGDKPPVSTTVITDADKTFAPEDFLKQKGIKISGAIISDGEDIVKLLAEYAQIVAKNILSTNIADVSSNALPEGWLDWNTLSLNQMAEHLRKKYMFDSSGDAKCIYHLIEFYDKHK